MSDVIDGFEELGQNARLRDASNEVLELALTDRTIDAAISSAVLSADRDQLEKMLGANANVCCVLMPSDDDEDEDAPEDAPADDEDSSSS